MGKKNANKKVLQAQLEQLKSRVLENPNDIDNINDDDLLDIEDNSDLEAMDDEEMAQEAKEVREANEKMLAELRDFKLKLEQKFNSKYTSKELWLERMTVVPNTEIDKQLNINDDIKRELTFYNLAHEAAIKGIIRLKEEKQKINRPDDFMAEMLKSDEQMIQVKKEIIQHEYRIKKFQLREEKMLNKKFNQNTKGKQNKESQEYKKVSTDAINHWKKSIKENPNEYYKLDDYVNKSVRNKKSMSRKDRNKRFNPKLAHADKSRENSKKSGFNKQSRAPKFDKKRPGKAQRTNKRKSK